jgi:hypothetical protein
MKFTAVFGAVPEGYVAFVSDEILERVNRCLESPELGREVLS